MNSVLFLGRDGVVLRRHARKMINSIWDAHFPDGAFRALHRAGNIFDHVIMVENVNLEAVYVGATSVRNQKDINEWMMDTAFAHDGAIDETYACPHGVDHPTMDGDDCFFPGADLFRRAIHEFDVDVERSFFLTDQLPGLEAADTVGIKPVLVLSGNGLRYLCELLRDRQRDEHKFDRIWGFDPFVCPDLYAFIDKDVVQPLSFYAQTTETPCKEVAHSNEVRIQQSLSRYLEAVRKTLQVSRTAGL